MPSSTTAGTSAPGAFPSFGVTPEMVSQMMGSPGFGGVPAGVSPEMVSQMLDNPLVQQQMQTLSQNPEMLRAMVDSPLFNNVPGVELIRSNPEMLGRMMQPENLRAMLQLQQAFGGMAPPPATGATPTGTGTGAVPPMFAFPGATAAPAPARPQPTTQELEARFAEQLAQLEDMGFTDRARNLRALSQTQGNVQFAIERLLQ